jgi:chromate transporter
LDYTGQMIDGLALGETVRGPLIGDHFWGFWGMGNTGIWHRSSICFRLLLPVRNHYFLHRLAELCLYFRRRPVRRNEVWQTCVYVPLRTVTAAVVGVIFNLVLFFAYHVFSPGGLGGRIVLFSLGLAATATIAVFQFNTGIIPMIISCGLFRMTWRLLA